MYVFAFDTVYHNCSFLEAPSLRILKGIRKGSNTSHPLFICFVMLYHYVVQLLGELSRFLETYDEHPDSNICDFILVRSTERYARFLSRGSAAGAQVV